MRINRRQMGLLLMGGIFVLSLIYYLAVISPGLSRKKSLIKYISKKETDFQKMVELRAQWERFEKSRVHAQKILAGRGAKFTLLSFLEGVSRDVGIDSKIQYIKPISHPEDSGTLKLSGMEMKLDDIDINQLLNFLYKVEYSGKLVRIYRIKIQRASKEKAHTLKVTLQVNTYA